MGADDGEGRADLGEIARAVCVGAALGSRAELRECQLSCDNSRAERICLSRGNSGPERTCLRSCNSGPERTCLRRRNSGHQPHQRSFTEITATNFAGDATFAHHEDSAAEPN